MGRPKTIYNDVKKIVSANLTQLLASRSMNQTQLSDKTNIPKQTINGYVKGTSLPTPINAEKIANVFNVKAEDIDPRLNMFNKFDMEETKEKLHIDEKELLFNIIDKIQSLDNNEREMYVDKLRYAVSLLEYNHNQGK